MPTVRKRRSRKDSRINNTRYGSRLKKRSCKSVKGRIQLLVCPLSLVFNIATNLVIHLFCHFRECIRERWDSKKTMKQNLAELGLSFDANRSLPVRNSTKPDSEVRWKKEVEDVLLCCGP